jgi:DNA phosphorothioation-dependent restriction protein DptG
MKSHSQLHQAIKMGANFISSRNTYDEIKNLTKEQREELLKDLGDLINTADNFWYALNKEIEEIGDNHD